MLSTLNKHLLSWIGESVNRFLVQVLDRLHGLFVCSEVAECEGAPLRVLLGNNTRDTTKLGEELAENCSVDFWQDLLNVQVGEVGNLVFACRFDSAAKLGATLDAVNADPAFAAWRMKNVKAGLATWVRSNQAYEITI